MKTCENCGSKVFSAGCVNCDEDNYIEIQRYEDIDIYHNINIEIKSNLKDKL